MHPRTLVQISPGRRVQTRGQDIAVNQETSAVQGNSGTTHLGVRTGSRKRGTGDAGELCEARRPRRPSCGGVRKTNAGAQGRCCTTDYQKAFGSVETDKPRELRRVCPLRRGDRTEKTGSCPVGAILPKVSGSTGAAVKLCMAPSVCATR